MSDLKEIFLFIQKIVGLYLFIGDTVNIGEFFLFSG